MEQETENIDQEYIEVISGSSPLDRNLGRPEGFQINSVRDWGTARLGFVFPILMSDNRTYKIQNSLASREDFEALYPLENCATWEDGVCLGVTSFKEGAENVAKRNALSLAYRLAEKRGLKLVNRISER